MFLIFNCSIHLYVFINHFMETQIGIYTIGNKKINLYFDIFFHH